MTLLEALIASAILLMAVLALTTAIAAGQAASIASQRLFLGAMLVDDLLSELSGVPHADLDNYDELDQPPGAIQTLDAGNYPDLYWGIGRRVEVLAVNIKEPATGVIVRGRAVTVTAYDERGELCSATVFLTEPAP